MTDQTSPAEIKALRQQVATLKAREVAYKRNQRALNKMGRLIASSLDVEQILQQVIQIVPPLVNADGVSILLKEGEDKLVFAAASGEGAKNLPGQTIPADRGIAGEVLASGSPSMLKQPQDRQKLYREVEEISGYHTRSLLAVPLVLADEVIGVMEAVHAQEKAFTEDDLHLLEVAGTWVSVAIGNARQHAAIERRLKETQALAAINQAINETLELDRLLQIIVDSINQTIPRIERVVIHLYDETTETLIPLATSGVETETRERLKMKSGRGIAGQVIASGKTINVPDTLQDERFIPIDGSDYLRALLVVPIQSGERRLGTISMSSKTPNAFTAEDEYLLTVIGVQAALAIERARLFTEIRRRLAETDTLYFISNLIVQSPELDVDSILYEVVDRLQREFGYYHVHIYLIDQKSRQLIAHQGSGAVGEALKDEGYQLSPEEGIVGYAAAIGETFFSNAVDEAPFYKPNPLLPDTGAELAAPLKAQDQLLGVLDVHHRRPHTFTEDDTRFLSAVAEQLAVVLDKAMLYHQLQTALRKEKSTRAQLVQTEKLAAMGRLIASVAHELNNPLQAIQNALYLVKLEGDLPPQTAEDLQVAIDESTRMGGLIARLRETYRPATAADFESTALNNIIEEVEKLLTTHLRHNNVRLEHDLDAALPPTRVIRDHIKQVVLNLCINAIESMPNGGVLTIQTAYRKKADQILIRISDTGTGIPPDVVNNIFEPFFTTKEGGTGLGLAVSYEIAQNHGGDIRVENNPGGGATFTLILPVLK